MVGLTILAFYSFLTNRSYYFYFLIGIVIGSIPIIFIINLGAVLIIPELSLLSILLVRSLYDSSFYYKSKVDKKASATHQDPAVFNMRSRFGMSSTGRMNEVWNPDSTLPVQKIDPSVEESNPKMQIFTFLLAGILLICSLISVYII
jgi:hypothetical protein